MLDAHSIYLLSAALVSVLSLIALIVFLRLNPVLSLLLVSLGLGLATGMNLAAAIRSFEAGLGSTLGHIAVVVALGTMLGKMMAASGASDRIANTLIDAFGEKNLPWAMMTIGLVVGLTAFFEVGFVLLAPLLFTIVRRTGSSIVRAGLPLLAGLSVVHALVPPHPAALMAVSAYHANVGRTIALALAIGLPTVILAGPVFARIVAERVRSGFTGSVALQMSQHETARPLPGFALSLLTIVFPVLLMLTGSLADGFAPAGSGLQQVLHLAGNDDLALLAGVLISFITLGLMQGFSRAELLKLSNECLAPTALILLLVGSGGGFGRLLADSGVSSAVIALALRLHVPLLLLAWLLAALMRLATGSATVAMTTAAGIVAPIALATGCQHPELLAIATGAGSVIFSHVNDAGFWMVKEYFNLSVPDTIRTWSVCETLISTLALAFTALAWSLS